MSARTLQDLAIFVRSKNAGPYMLTIDVFFESAADCTNVLEAPAFTRASIAKLYGVAEELVKIIPVPQARAIKISLPRPRPAGDVGEADVAGGQQFLPLLGLSVA